MKLVSKISMRALVASFLPGIGKATLWKIVSNPDFSRSDDDEELAHLFPELAEFRDRSPKFKTAKDRALDQAHRAAEAGCSIVGFWDDNYPRSFRRASLAPAIFWYRGSLEALRLPQVAVIGTRDPSRAGEVSAHRISTAFALSGLNIVSGLALGIDAIAHRAAIRCDRPTIAVMPGGLDNIAPKTNASLAMDICGSGGGLLSEFPIGTAPFPANFVTRDATQAALSAAVILVQSDKKGGSLHASRACVRLGRTLVVVAPSNGDVEVGEPKIAANLVLISGTPGEATRSMEFPQNAKEYIYPLSSKEQYQEVIQLIKTAWEGFAPKRVGMDSQPMRR